MLERAGEWNQTRVVAWLHELRKEALAPPKSALTLSLSSGSVSALP